MEERKTITLDLSETQERILYNPNHEQIYKARLTVVEQIYHQQHGTSPTNIEEKYSTVLESEEQPYVRKTKVGDTWTALDVGWIETFSLVRISNNEGCFQLVNQTPEQVEETKARILEIGFKAEVPHILVYPTESARFRPQDGSYIFLRCRKGACKITVNIYPG